MYHDPDRSWITDPDPDHPKGTHPGIHLITLSFGIDDVITVNSYASQMKATRHHTNQILHKFLVHKLNNLCISVTQNERQYLSFTILIRYSYKDHEILT